MDAAKTLSDLNKKAAETKLQQFHLKLALDVAGIGKWDWNTRVVYGSKIQVHS